MKDLSNVDFGPATVSHIDQAAAYIRENATGLVDLFREQQGYAMLAELITNDLLRHAGSRAEMVVRAAAWRRTAEDASGTVLAR